MHIMNKRYKYMVVVFSRALLLFYKIYQLITVKRRKGSSNAFLLNNKLIAICMTLVKMS